MANGHGRFSAVSTAVVIPARDEAACVAAVVARVRDLGFAVFVVDDFSADDTADLAQQAGACVLRMPFHAGSWVATQTGMRVALSRGYRQVVTLDADGQHDPEDIPRLLGVMASAESQPAVIVGACTARGNLRRKLAWQVLRLLSGLKVADITSGFRLYGHQALQVAASRDCTLLEYQDVGVLLQMHRIGLDIVEVAVGMRPRENGQSRIFKSWFAVARYLVYSTLVSISRRQYGRSPAYADEARG